MGMSKRTFTQVKDILRQLDSRIDDVRTQRTEEPRTNSAPGQEHDRGPDGPLEPRRPSAQPRWSS